MDPRVFKSFRDIIYDSCGIALTDDKVNLLSNRIFKRMHRLSLTDPASYLELVKKDTSGEELIHLINAISTNVTHFFREPEHFDRLKDFLKDLTEKKKDRIRVWCAASSTGEEPYTIAMTAAETLNLNASDFKLLATDINIEVLKHARRGYYLETQVEKIPKLYRTKYFTRVKLDEDYYWQIKPELARYVIFSRLNLVDFPYKIKSQVDVIFCRNVLIYFDLETRQRVIDEMYRLLVPGGYLLLSRSENMLGITHSFNYMSESVYRKG